VPVAYLTSVLQSLPLQDDILFGMVPTVPLVPTVAAARAAFGGLLSVMQASVLDDPSFLAYRVPRKLSLLPSNFKQEALLALPARKRLAEAVESAAQPGCVCVVTCIPG
jgi:hypothetical protein